MRVRFGISLCEQTASDDHRDDFITRYHVTPSLDKQGASEGGSRVHRFLCVNGYIENLNFRLVLKTFVVAGYVILKTTRCLLGGVGIN